MTGPAHDPNEAQHGNAIGDPGGGDDDPEDVADRAYAFDGVMVAIVERLGVVRSLLAHVESIDEVANALESSQRGASEEHRAVIAERVDWLRNTASRVEALVESLSPEPGDPEIEDDDDDDDADEGDE